MRSSEHFVDEQPCLGVHVPETRVGVHEGLEGVLVVGELHALEHDLEIGAHCGDESGIQAPWFDYNDGQVWNQCAQCMVFSLCDMVSYIFIMTTLYYMPHHEM